MPSVKVSSQPAADGLGQHCLQLAQTRWRYKLEPAGNGTVLKESFEVLWFLPMVVRLAFGGSAARQAQLETGVQDTLVRIKEVAEAS